MYEDVVSGVNHRLEQPALVEARLEGDKKTRMEYVRSTPSLKIRKCPHCLPMQAGIEKHALRILSPRSCRVSNLRMILNFCGNWFYLTLGEKKGEHESISSFLLLNVRE